MKNMKHIYGRLLLQLIAILLLFIPMFERIETNYSMTVFSSLLSLIAETPTMNEYSFMSVIGLSQVLNTVIFITIISILICIGISIVQYCKKDCGQYSLVHKVSVCLQTVCVGILGILTTCTITTTLEQNNIKFYLKALIGRENYKLLQSISNSYGSSLHTILESMYGSTYYDYWAYLKVTPVYYAVLLVFLVMTLITFWSYRKTCD